jgi:hypothetical protein
MSELSGIAHRTPRGAHGEMLLRRKLLLSVCLSQLKKPFYCKGPVAAPTLRLRLTTWCPPQHYKGPIKHIFKKYFKFPEHVYCRNISLPDLINILLCFIYVGLLTQIIYLQKYKMGCRSQKKQE